MKIQQDKLSTKDLRIGMYVCKLDCSWLDTPFPFQGFFIRSKKEIEELQIFCKFVYIDAKQGNCPYKQSEISKPSPLLVNEKQTLKKTSANKFRKAHVNIGKYPKENTSFKKEMKKATSLFSDLNHSIQQLNFNLKVGKKLNLTKTKEITQNIVKSVLRNPNSLFCLSRLKEKGGYTYNHSLRSSILAAVFGRYLGLSEENLLNLTTGVLLADIGKSKIKRQLLNSKDAPTTKEKLILQSHVELGVEILAKDQGIANDVLVIVETHHERYNGSGYPLALVGDELPYLGQIAGIVDVFDAITNKKSYGKHIDTANAMDWLFRQRDKLFASELVDDFIQAIGLYPAGTKVELTDQSTAVVISHNQQKRLRPIVLLVKNNKNQKLRKPKEIDLSKRAFLSNKDRPMVHKALVS